MRENLPPPHPLLPSSFPTPTALLLCSEEQELSTREKQYDQVSKGEKEVQIPWGSQGSGPNINTCALPVPPWVCCSGCLS